METTFPPWSKIMKRELVVPWSSAPAYCATSFPPIRSNFGARGGPSGVGPRARRAPDEERAGCRAGVLVPGAALSEVARPALARHERDRGGDALVGRARRAGERRSEAGALAERGPEGLAGREEGVEHRLVAGLGLAAGLHARDRRVEAVPPRLGRELRRVAGRCAELQEEGPVEGPAGPADLRDQAHRDALHDAADVAGLVAVQLLDGRAHAAVHVDAVVGVADRLVEARQLVLLLADDGREGPDPGCDLGGRRPTGPRGARGLRHAPQRSPAVLTGASQRRVSSSSSLRSVIEQPAISSEVMYGPTRLRPAFTPRSSRIDRSSL